MKTAPARKTAHGKAKPAAKSAARVTAGKKAVVKQKPSKRPAPQPTRKPLPAKAIPAAKAAPAKPVLNGHHPAPPVKAMSPAAFKPVAAGKVITIPPKAPHKMEGTLMKKPGASQSGAVKVELAISPDKDLSVKGDKAGQFVKDRIVLMVPDPYWLHTSWELSAQSVQRAEAALGQDWHFSKPIIRLFDVTSQDTTSTSETPVRDIPIHGGCSHWYIDVTQPPRTYRADIGYLSRRGQFYVLARSNVVTPPKAGASEPVEESWKTEVENKGPEKILAMSSGYEAPAAPSQLTELIDEQFRRPLKDGAFGSGATPPAKLKKFFFELDAELMVYGKTDPGATVTLQNEPVKLRPDGTFTMRFGLPDSRQIIPAVATAADGMEERTIVLAVERNTKHLDPMVHDLYGE